MKTIKTSNGTVISSEEFFNDMSCGDHIEDILLPAIEAGDWNKLEKLEVIYDSSTSLMFSENVWSLKDFGDGYQGNRIQFNHSTRKGFDGYILPRNIRNEIKCFACVELLTDYGRCAYLSIVDTVSKLTEIAKHATEIGITTFSDVDEEALLRMADNGLKLNVKGNKTLCAINRIVQCQYVLPINIEIKRKLQPKNFNLQNVHIDQNFVIPHRIYFKMLNNAMNNIREAYVNRIKLEGIVEKFLIQSEEIKRILIGRVRSGELPLRSILAVTGTLKESKEAAIIRVVNGVVEVFEKRGVPIVDYGKNDQWEAIWDLCENNNLNINYSGITDFHVKIGTKKIKKRSQFLTYIRDLQADASFICMALSGMRISEMFGVSPVYGAQDHIKIGAGTIYAFTTKQEKLSLDSQTADDVYITNLTGFKAFHVLNAIHKPYRKRFKTNSQSVFFAALTEVYCPRPIKKEGLGRTVMTTINRIYKKDLTLTQGDIEDLRTSNPLNSNIPEFGEIFSYSNHQCRRSFSFYLIGLELMDFPQLKQQLGHISIAMSRWYANNAHSFKTLYSEVSNERTQWTSKILSRIYNKLANKERLAGGLGKSLSSTIFANELFFSEGINNRKLDADFWVSEIKTGKVHIHAIGKGMYCTKLQCAMRVEIDLSECNDCAWDIIEDAYSVESLRMTAMINLLILIEEGELNGSSAAKLIMDIRSAEKIMSDLGFPFEIFDIPEDAAVMITIKEVL